MGLLGILIATAIIILLMIFYNPLFANSKNAASPLDRKKIESNATQTVNKATENKKLENDRIKNIDVK